MDLNSRRVYVSDNRLSLVLTSIANRYLLVNGILSLAVAS